MAESQYNSEKSIQIAIWLALTDMTGEENWLMTGDGWEIRGVKMIF